MSEKNKPYEYISDELEVGMEVALPLYSNYLYRHTKWTKHTISKLTPKKTKATLDNSMTITAVKTYSGYESKLYRYEPWMDEETQLAITDRETADVLYGFQRISATDFIMSIPESEMPVVHDLVIGLKKYVDEYKSKRKSRWGY